MNDYSKLLRNIKIFFFSLLYVISMIFLIIFSVKVFTNSALHDELVQTMNIKIQEQRAFFLISLSTFFVLSLFLFYMHHKWFDVYNEMIGAIWLLSYIFLPLTSIFHLIYYPIIIIKEKQLGSYLKETYQTKSVFPIYPFDKWESDQEKTRILKNTFYSLFQFAISVVAFLLMVFTTEAPINEPNGSLMLGTYSYFTELSNLSTIVLMILLFMTGYRFFFKNNSFLLAVICYIAVTGIVFSAAFGLMIILYYNPFSETFPAVKSIWFHLVNPFFFVIYGAYVLKVSKQPLGETKSFVIYSGLYPLIYTLYVYSLPFFTSVSIYGFVTNLNANVVPYRTPENLEYYGGWPSSFFILGLIILFSLTVFLARYLLAKNLKKWNSQKE
ncbi:MAG: DUF1600 domain-containing protein [Mycoplasmoidaceae bacterium]